MGKRDHTREAEALFQRFAERHDLSYIIEAAPIEVCWTFPEQSKLSLPVTLCLQSGDELNFGVADFWSYFFPFQDVAEEFECILNAWVRGEARVAILGPVARVLQVRDEGRWKSVYHANRLLPIWRPPIRTIRNHPSS